jgi:hypothetical protein
MPLSLLNHSALALFAQRTRIPPAALASVPFGFVLVRVREGAFGLAVAAVVVVGFSFSVQRNP